jgi:molybdate transport system permease protein
MRKAKFNPFLIAGLPLLLLLALPALGLISALSPGELIDKMGDPLVLSALGLSLRSSLVSLAIIIVFGTPLAWWLSQRPPSSAWSLLIDLPMVLPPAVTGLALLMVFGSQGLLSGAGSVAFSFAAVIIAQTVVAAPFYLQAGATSFRSIDQQQLLAAQNLGSAPIGAFMRIALPLALPGLVNGAALAWARALGEFGATLLFAGNLPGRSQTMPLAIYSALQSDISAALALAFILAALALALLLALRLLPRLINRP